MKVRYGISATIKKNPEESITRVVSNGVFTVAEFIGGEGAFEKAFDHMRRLQKEDEDIENLRKLQRKQQRDQKGLSGNGNQGGDEVIPE